MCQFLDNYLNNLNELDGVRSYDCGAQGVVLFCSQNGRKHAWKISQEIAKESELIKTVQEYHKGEQFNVVKIFGNRRVSGIEIELINGMSLQSILCRNEINLSKLEKEILGYEGFSTEKDCTNVKISEEKTLYYAYDILNGLIEMKEAGVHHHRDIRPANIMIDEEKNRAVIIDLGIATQDINAFGYKNTRYGGSHDLISLGQIMYRMAVGKHLFVDSPEMERTTYKEKIKSDRDRLYEFDSGVLMEHYLNKVYRNVNSLGLKNIITGCLLAQKEDHYKIRSIFEHYLFS